MNKQAGFTIVELVVVIALLGILAAVALPRFINVTDDAHAAAVEGIAGSFRSGVALQRAEDVAAGGTGAYPGNGAAAAADCVTAWGEVIDVSGASAATDNSGDYTATYAANVCTFTYNAAAGHNFTYNVNTGALVVTTP